METRIALVESALRQHNSDHATEKELAKEFRYRTDIRLENVNVELKTTNAALGAISKQLDSWATIRKTLAWIGSGVLGLGSLIGWGLHEIFPNGIWGGHGT